MEWFITVRSQTLIGDKGDCVHGGYITNAKNSDLCWKEECYGGWKIIESVFSALADRGL